MIIFFFSSFYHICECHSEELYFNCRKGDFSGIIFGIYFIAITYFYYGFYHLENVSLIYSIIMTLFTLFTATFALKGENAETIKRLKKENHCNEVCTNKHHRNTFKNVFNKIS